MRRFDESALDAPDSTRSTSWASGSLVVVLPVRGAPVGSRPIGPGNPLWDLRTSMRPTPVGASSIAIDAARLGAMRSGVAYTAVEGKDLRTNRALAEALPQPGGCLVRAVEIFTYADVEVMSYVVLHIVLTPAALEKIPERVTWFVDPDIRSEQAPRRWSSPQRHALLRALGFDSPTRWRLDDIRPFVITHLVPDARSTPVLVPEETPDDARFLAPEQQWARRLSTGTRIDDPSRDADPDQDLGSAAASTDADGFWVGSTWCRASRSGLALIGTRGFLGSDTPSPTDEQASETADRPLDPAALEGFAHHDVVDIIILAMRQSAFLDRHADVLADAWDFELDSAPTTLDSLLLTGQQMRAQAVEFDERLAGFRRNLWLEFEDGNAAVHRTITSVQRAWGLRTRLHEVESEQSAISDALIGSADHINRRVAGHCGADPTQRSVGRPFRTRLVESALLLVVGLGMVHAANQVVQGDRGPAPYFWVALLTVVGVLVGLWAVGRVVARRTDPPND